MNINDRIKATREYDGEAYVQGTVLVSTERKKQRTAAEVRANIFG